MATRELLERLYDSSLQEILHLLGARLGLLRSRALHSEEASKLRDSLRSSFGKFNTNSLVGVEQNTFKQHILSSLSEIDSRAEGFAIDEIDRQRDLSIKFHWGHNHDFGDYRVDGLMADRHIELLVAFLTLFKIPLDELRRKSILDVGCWTGGTTLLLASLGNSVMAIEEVRKYVEMASYLSQSFGLQNTVTVRPASIFDCDTADYHDRFEVVYCPGVIYHVSDPVLALRILFNSLTPNGFILLESAGINRLRSLCRFEGSLTTVSGRRELLNRSGWNYFIPSPSALGRMMSEAGFDQVRTAWSWETNRLFAFGRKIAQVGICRAGLSARAVR